MDIAQIQSLAKIARNPDALYASALGALHLSPEIQAILSPVGKAVFDAGYAFATHVAGDSVNQLGSTMLDAAGSAFSESAVKAAAGVAQSVVTGVAEAMPLVNTVVNDVMVIAAIGAANTALAQSYQAQAVHDFLAPANNPGSGPGGAIEPADLFAPITSSYGTCGGQGYYLTDGCSWYRPSQPVGAALVAITEDTHIWGAGEDVDSTQAFSESNFLHHRQVLEGLGKQDFETQTAIADAQSGDTTHELLFANANVGIDPSRRAIYRSLRMAIGSHSETDAHGLALHSIYMDMLLDDYNAGHITGSWMVYLMTHVYVPGIGMVAADKLYTELPSDRQGFFHPIPISVDQAVSLANQIGSMLSAWAQNRSKIHSAYLHLNFGSAIGLAVAAKQVFGKPLFSLLSNYNWSVRACILLNAYRKSLVPRSIPLQFNNPGLLKAFSKK